MIGTESEKTFQEAKKMLARNEKKEAIDLLGDLIRKHKLAKYFNERGCNLSMLGQHFLAIKDYNCAVTFDILVKKSLDQKKMESVCDLPKFHCPEQS